MKPPAHDDNVSVSTSTLEGELTGAFDVADVPLHGPGTWTLSTGGAVNALLRCPASTEAIVTKVVIATAIECQLQLRLVDTSTSLAWQLTPVR